MPRNDDDTPSVDEIMARIRRQMKRDRAGKADHETAPAGTFCTASFGKDRCTTSALPERDVYKLDDFLVFEDELFLTNAYLGIIRREPDPDGSTPYLEGLRSGMMTKVDILGRLHFSAEGRKHKVTVRGLLLPFAWNTACHIPVLGYALRLLEGLIQLPSLLQEQRRAAAGRYRLQVQANENAQLLKNALIAQFQEGVQAQEKEALLEELGKIIHRETFLGTTASEAQRVEKQSSSTMPDGMYAALEEVFRGSRAMILQRLSIYLEHIEKQGIGSPETPIIDLGCGRGEFLELMQRRGKTAQGVEKNRVFVGQCRNAGLHVIEQDVLSYLGGLRRSSVGCVVAIHLIEHLAIATMLELFREAYRVLVPEGLLIIETPNPENLQVGACLFHLDPTHRTLMPPVSARHMLENFGFGHTKTLRLHPFPEDEIPKNLKDAKLPELIRLLYGPRDYALIARKSDNQFQNWSNRVGTA